MSNKQIHFSIKGRFGRSVEVSGDSVRVHWGLLFNESKALPIRSITEVQVRKPSLVSDGLILFLAAGLNSRTAPCVVFRGQDKYETALRIQEYVNSGQAPAAATGRFCSSCGSPLQGRFCGRCGKDSVEVE